jgi:transposase
MAEIERIRALHRDAGWSQRKIARELDCDRATVAKYARAASTQSGEADSKPAISTAGKKQGHTGRRSDCEPFRQQIEEGLEKGLGADRIWRELKAEHGFSHSYESVKRYVRRLKAKAPKRIWRMECEPGEEAQVDFGVPRTLKGEKGKLRPSNVLRVKLSFSRKAYTESLPRQATECLLRALENAFRHFGGVPASLRLDNLKAAVKRADWYDPEVNPMMGEFAQHYGFTIFPIRPAHPKHNGKVERDIAYVKGALKGRQFASLAEQNAWLRKWESEVADQRIHGTTRKQVQSLFLEGEKPALRPLPPSLFPCFQEGKRRVHQDSYVVLEQAYYEAPAEYIGREVWVRWDSKTVRIFDENMRQLIFHVRLEPGKFSACLGARGQRPGSPQHSSLWWVSQARMLLGSEAGKWAGAVAKNRPEHAIRVLQGLLKLRVAGTRPASLIDRACAIASSRAQYHLAGIKNILKHLSKPAGSKEREPLYQPSLSLLEEHPMIRPLETYSQVLACAAVPAAPQEAASCAPTAFNDSTQTN